MVSPARSRLRAQAANKSKRKAELEAEGSFRPYVLSRLYKLQGVDKPLARTRGRALAYLQCLLEFHSGPNDLSEALLAGRFGKIPPAVLNHLTHRFAVRARWLFSPGFLVVASAPRVAATCYKHPRARVLSRCRVRVP